MTLAITTFFIMAQTQICQFQKYNHCLVNFMKDILSFVHVNTDLSISEGFFNKIMNFGSVLLCLRGCLIEGNWFVFGLPRPEFSLYCNHSKCLFNNPTILSVICIYLILLFI